jgi:hypothetical protein
MEKQLLPIHYIAYILQPKNRVAWNTYFPKHREKVEAFINNYSGNLALKQFYNYLEQDGTFNITSFWNKSDTPGLFWRLVVSLAIASKYRY